MTTTTARTRNEYDRKFRQSTHGQREYGQTPYGMFLETYNSHTTNDGPPSVAAVRVRSGKPEVWKVAKTREEVLLWVLQAVDGHMTEFDHDDYSARLIVLNDTDSQLAWVEMLNPGSRADAHPEIEV